MVSGLTENLHVAYDSSKDRALQPHYETWSDLQPFTENPGTSINLETIIRGEHVDIPKSLPSKITRAFVELSLENVAFGATVEADGKISPGEVPQPYLGEVELDASYAWGKVKEFKFDFKVIAGIEPSDESKHKEAAVLTGDLSYTRESGSGE
jgi:hypothetical protein